MLLEVLSEFSLLREQSDRQRFVANFEDEDEDEDEDD
jgi:hypothetical protein